MTSIGIAAARTRPSHEAPRVRRAMGAQERRRWSSFVRQDDVSAVAELLFAPQSHGVAVLGPHGVGKTTLARAVEARLAPTTHIVRLFGSPTETSVSYGAWSLLLARLPAGAVNSPTAIIHGISGLLRKDAGERRILVVLDDLPELDTLSMGVIMHLLLSGTCRLLVMARDPAHLPDDLAWQIKDGLLAEHRLANFSRAEVRALLRGALGSVVSESAVMTLFNASSGNPLVLHALVNEQIGNGNLVLNDRGWAIAGAVTLGPEFALVELVRARLARESERVRDGMEKMGLIRRAPLSVVLAALGADCVAEMEERGLLSIESDAVRSTTLKEPYLGETVRSWLDERRLAALFADISSAIFPDAAHLEPADLMTLAAWAQDAGLRLEPDIAVAAAAAAVRHFDPTLALRCTEFFPAHHPLAVMAARHRSSAFNILADYQRALAELEAVDAVTLGRLAVDDYAEWVVSLVKALLWVPDGYDRVPEVVARAEAHVAELAERNHQAPDGLLRAARMLRLAWYKFQVHRGEFAEVLGELEAGSRDADAEYRLNCKALLVPALAVLGRELDAISLGREVTADIDEHSMSVLTGEWHTEGLILALIWSGQWQECVTMLQDVLVSQPQASQYRGGPMELALGLAYTYAGRGSEAVQILLAAAAQLEVREVGNELKLAYSALAFAYAQIDDEEQARSFLALAESYKSPTTWISRSMGTFCRLMALRWLDDPQASARLVKTAQTDIAKGRVTTASMCLFGATVRDHQDQFPVLEEISVRRQGPMALLNAAVARACQDHDPLKALAAAAIAEDLHLDAVESRCAVLALDFANQAGLARLARLAQQRIDRLQGALPHLPLFPRSKQVQLTQREVQVARLAARGLGNRAIADRIGVSLRTVEGHLYQVFMKRGISSRAELEALQDL